MERPHRELIFVVSARTLQSLYMLSALCRLALFPNATIIPTVSEPQDISSAIRIGRPTDYMPSLSQSDVVYTSGAPVITEAVSRIAKAAGVKCYADPFVSSASIGGPDKLVERLIGWFQH
jgi:3-phenylpropionate/trans-cinnamate dioxygenase ferredoxin reductase subunit